MRVGQTIQVGRHTIVVPTIYEEFKTVPGDPPMALSVGTKTDMGTAAVSAYPIGNEQMMPSGSQEELVAALRETLPKTSGIVEVEVGKTPDGELPYSLFLLKTTRGSGSLEYILALDILFADDDAIHVQGYFDEGPVTGMRANIVLASLLRAGEVFVDGESSTIRGWAADPYDKSIRKGFLCNRSEDRVYDDKFPWHPLTLARSLYDSIVESL